MHPVAWLCRINPQPLPAPQVGIRHLVIGGVNEDWPIPEREDSLPEVTMDPMRVGRPRGLGRDDDSDDDSDDD